MGQSPMWAAVAEGLTLPVFWYTAGWGVSAPFKGRLFLEVRYEAISS